MSKIRRTPSHSKVLCRAMRQSLDKSLMMQIKSFLSCNRYIIIVCDGNDEDALEEPIHVQDDESRNFC